MKKFFYLVVISVLSGCAPAPTSESTSSLAQKTDSRSEDTACFYATLPKNTRASIYVEDYGSRVYRGRGPNRDVGVARFYPGETTKVVYRVDNMSAFLNADFGVEYVYSDERENRIVTGKIIEFYDADDFAGNRCAELFTPELD